MGPQRRTALTRTDTAGFSEITYGGHNHTVQWNATLSPYWLVEASFARAYNHIEETPSVNEWFVTNRLVTPNVRSGGIGFYEVGNEGETLQYQLKSTNIVNFFGNHQSVTGCRTRTSTTRTSSIAPGRRSRCRMA